MHECQSHRKTMWTLYTYSTCKCELNLFFPSFMYVYVDDRSTFLSPRGKLLRLAREVFLHLINPLVATKNESPQVCHHRGLTSLFQGDVLFTYLRSKNLRREYVQTNTVLLRQGAMRLNGSAADCNAKVPGSKLALPQTTEELCYFLHRWVATWNGPAEVQKIYIRILKIYRKNILLHSFIKVRHLNKF